MTASTKRPDIEALTAELAGIAAEAAPNIVRQKSRDFFWYSPILKEKLENCVGDLVVTPQSEAEVMRIAQLCARHRVPLTVRGAGTGNYGQAVPLAGGVVLDMIALNAIHPVADGVLRVGPGAKMRDIDVKTRPEGWELRMFPSTARTATIGGFIAGGSGGIGSITYGMLNDPGAVLGLRMVTVEAEPRIIELRGRAVNRVQHAYGTNGIITELELPMAPAQCWVEIIVAFDDFPPLARFCQAVGDADGIAKKLITAVAWPLPQYFRTLPVAAPDGAALGLMMIAAASVEPFLELLESHGGRPLYRKTEEQAARDRAVPVYEFTWNHTTLQVLKVDKSMTYLQSAFPDTDTLAHVDKMRTMFGDEVMMHVEFVRDRGRTTCRGLQVVRFSTAARLAEIIAIHEAQGCMIFNPHTFVLEDGGRKITDPEQLAFKRATDPLGLMNPGKMRGWDEMATDPHAPTCLQRRTMLHP